MENRKVSSNKNTRRQAGNASRIPFLKGRPKRDSAIGRDDCTDLKIVLHTCKSVDELLKHFNKVG
jgi:hypothetical protein